ncbi:conserved hypothetical protein [Oleispira antarctica RB-8]|uniref:DNA phosphorothioation-associated methyltransferase n=1 Tax=Oleispira antarctica RB-8 TaxID=698738 RepID=R4YPH8_OLEAN|nr:conserved hypothetical protein [Oleispira antarctica RB-8]
MDFNTFNALVKSITIGKHLPEAVYLHKSALECITTKLSTPTLKIAKALNIPDDHWTLVKYSKRDFKLSLLYYPTFQEEPYPPLHKSYTIDLTKLTARETNYTTSENPPILHRRECFIEPNHPDVEQFRIFTEEGEGIGLYQNTRTIGFKNNWNKLIKRKGYFLDEQGHIKSLSKKIIPEPSESFYGEIDRHKTAISRDKLSTPMLLLAQRGYLNGDYSVLDYGCGKGDDIRELEAHNIECIGWDPVHSPDTDIQPCDIVNLGFVINVIEDKEERQETLKIAYAHCQKIILISAMLGNEKIYERFKPYKDGVLTQRNTFQKYYYQAELQSYLELALEENAIALGPGVFVIFKDKVEEQRYLLERQKSRKSWRQLSQPVKAITQKQSKDIYSKHKILLEDFWYTCLELARVPQNDEFDLSDQIRQICGSHIKAFSTCIHIYEQDSFDLAQQARKDDLLVYFSLGFFKKRDSYTRMPQSLKRDIKIHFNKYSEAREAGLELLHNLNSPELIYNQCVNASTSINNSYLDEQHSLTINKDKLNELPKELRVYVGCATQLYGELDNVNLIKIHIRSGKVTLMVYEGFNELPIPLLKERIKINMRTQEIDFFDYFGEFTPQPLYNKSLFMSESDKDYKKQLSFEKRLSDLGIKTSGYIGLPKKALEATLRQAGVKLKGYRLCKIT